MLTTKGVDPTAPLPSKFDERYMRHTFRTRTAATATGLWDQPRITAAREAQMCGRTSRSAPLADSMMTDGAVYPAVLNRIAPARALPHEMRGLPDADREAEAIRQEEEYAWREGGDALTPGAKANLFEALVQHGFAVYQNVLEPRADGSRIDFRVVPFPMRCIDWDPYRKTLRAQTEDGIVDVIHGDGKWGVVQLFDVEPWKRGALVPASLLWSDHAYGVLSRGRNSDGHAEGKPVGELPPGIATTDPEGVLLQEALQHLADQDWGVVVPNGTNLRYLEMMSQAWQIYRERIVGSSGDIFRVYLGQDGSVSKTGGNYIKDGILAGVRYDLVEGDLRAVERGLNSATLRVKAALNFGRFDTPASLFWLLPDPDEDARRASEAARTKSYNEDLEAFRKNGFVVDQPFADMLAKKRGIVAPLLAVAAPSGAEYTVAEVEGGVVTINEIRRRKGDPPVPWGDVSVPQRRAQVAREGAALADGAPAP